MSGALCNPKNEETRGIAQLVERRSPKPKAVGSIPTAPAIEKGMKMKVSPALFVRQVKQEIAKITWPNRQETIMGTVSVAAICLILSVCLFVIDATFAFLIRQVVGG